jgi:hypothetical protein
MSDLDLLRALVDYRLELPIWVLSSILAYAFASNLWYYRRLSPDSRLGRLLVAGERWPHSRWATEVVRFLYYLCIPYLALARGVDSPSLMGLWSQGWFQPQWFGQIALGMTLAGAALILLVWGWRQALSASSQVDDGESPTEYLLQRRLLVVPWGWGLIVLEVLYLEMHWAFYRSATIRLLDPYYGVFAGLLLVVGELWLNPAVRDDLSVSRRGGQAMTTIAIALVISVIYYFTTNLWLCLAAHLLVQFGLLSFLEVYPRLSDHK